MSTGAHCVRLMSIRGLSIVDSATGAVMTLITIATGSTTALEELIILTSLC